MRTIIFMPGYMSWKTGDFGLNPEHPPMVKMLAALPLLAMDLKVPPLQGREFKHEAFLNGKEFVFGNDADTLLFRARMAASLLTVLLAVLVFLRRARDVRYWRLPSVAFTLLVFDPNLLAHGALVTTDAGLSCFLFAAVYAFYRYVKQPSHVAAGGGRTRDGAGICRQTHRSPGGAQHCAAGAGGMAADAQRREDGPQYQLLAHGHRAGRDRGD